MFREQEGKVSRMQVTLRQRLGGLLALWVLLSVLCAIAGPFDTHAALNLAERGVYWASIVGLSIVGSFLVRQSPLDRWPGKVISWVIFALILALCISLINAFTFAKPQAGGGLMYLFGIILLSVAVINGLLQLLQRNTNDTITTTIPPRDDPEQRFMRRLPPEARGPLVRIEAQDHYLNVVTTKGAALILMRLAEAVDELQDVAGLQTHRSHWVKLGAVQAHRRSAGRDTLVMADGATVPVARGRRAAAQMAGLF